MSEDFLYKHFISQVKPALDRWSGNSGSAGPGETEVDIFPEQEVAYASMFESDVFGLVAGETYWVQFGSDTFECICFTNGANGEVTIIGTK